ncbi:MAG TPA: hypothetical protein VGN72_00225 [Tepidisphaeraceae bacterium]|nr:hypothetical protein [Tepidisphaeraceae bacterium]
MSKSNSIGVKSAGAVFLGGAMIFARVYRRLIQLLDVGVTNPTDGQVLTYNQTSGKWQNETPAVVEATGKADKVAGATAGNLAGLDADGNLTDSGSNANEFATDDDLDTLTTTVATKAAQGDVDELSTLVDTKAATSTVDALAVTVAAKADQVDLDNVEAEVTSLQGELDGKAALSDLTAHTGNTSNPHSTTASQVGAYTTAQVDTLLTDKANVLHGHTMGEVAYLSDELLNLQANIDTKAPLASPTFTGTVTAPTFVGSLTGNATTATSATSATFASTAGTASYANTAGTASIASTLSGDIPISQVTSLQTALDAKAPLASPTFTGTVTAGAITATSGLKNFGSLRVDTPNAYVDVYDPFFAYSNVTVSGALDHNGSTLSFFNAGTPVARQSATTDIKDALTNYGLLQGTSASPLNLDGGTLTAGAITLGSFVTGGLSSSQMYLNTTYDSIGVDAASGFSHFVDGAGYVFQTDSSGNVTTAGDITAEGQLVAYQANVTDTLGVNGTAYFNGGIEMGSGGTLIFNGSGTLYMGGGVINMNDGTGSGGGTLYMDGGSITGVTDITGDGWSITAGGTGTFSGECFFAYEAGNANTAYVSSQTDYLLHPDSNYTSDLSGGTLNASGGTIDMGNGAIYQCFALEMSSSSGSVIAMNGGIIDGGGEGGYLQNCTLNQNGYNLFMGFGDGTGGGTLFVDGGTIQMGDLGSGGGTLYMDGGRIERYTATKYNTNAAAITGGLAVGTFYVTTTGEVRCVV